MTQERMRVLLVTPYSPLVNHEHAAQDLAVPFAAGLARAFDLHVFASDGRVSGRIEIESGVWATFHAAAPAKPLNRLAAAGPYPKQLRHDWRKVHTRQLGELVSQLQPDLVHCEYLQPAEGLLAVDGMPRTLTLHDVLGPVLLSQVQQARGWRRVRLWWEHRLVRRVERKILEAADHVFTFSERDARLVASTKDVSIVRIGVRPSPLQWEPDDSETLLFAGALWRAQNELIAVQIIERVMPVVWSQRPAARLRIVGARPSDDLRAKAHDPRIEIAPDVQNLDEEFASASVNLAPSVVPAGVLLKALRSMAVGCPVILNAESAEPLTITNGVHALVASDVTEIGNLAVHLLRDRTLASRIGRAGKDFVQANYSWDEAIRSYREVFDAFQRT